MLKNDRIYNHSSIHWLGLSSIHSSIHLFNTWYNCVYSLHVGRVQTGGLREGDEILKKEITYNHSSIHRLCSSTYPFIHPSIQYLALPSVLLAVEEEHVVVTDILSEGFIQ